MWERSGLVYYLCILALNTLLDCGHTEDAELIVEPNSPYLFSGESVTFICDMREGTDTDWLYTFNRNGRPVVSFSTDNSYSLNLTADLSGDYQCTGRHKVSTKLTKQSNNVTLSVSAGRPVATLRAGRTTIPVGGTLTLTCSVEGSAGWKYDWFRRSSDSHETLIITNGEQNINISQNGIYRCRGGRGKPVFLTEYSDDFRAEMTLSNRISVTLQHSWTKVFSGETITLVCKIKTGGDTEWVYEWRTTSSHTPPTHRVYRISSVSVSHSGRYWCKGRRDSYSSTEWSNAVQLLVSSYRPRPKVIVQKRTIPEGGNQILTCDMEDSAEWKYYWFRRTSVFSESQIIRDGKPETVLSVSQGGIYHCRGGRGNPVVFTEDSDAVTIEKRVSNKAVVTSQPNWPLIFSGETITVICDIHERGNTAWEYEWSKPNSNTTLTDNECRISSATVSDSGNYRCMGKKKWDLYSTTEWSDVITLTVSSHRPKANLSADSRAFPAGGSATLTCSANPPSFGWKYLWFREQTAFQHLTTQEFVFLSNETISVSQEGLYTCIGGRGDPIYYTEYSDSIRIYKIATKGAVVTMQPNWPELYSGETVTLRCEIQGGDTKWEYEWMTTSSFKPPNQNEYRISSVSPSHIGDYWCKGRLERAQQNSTGWSISFKLTTSYKPQPVLTVSPLWLSPGASVTLNCSVKHSSAGWRFFWYKAVPKLSDNSYSYELIPGSINGTEQDSYIVDGQTHTAGYVCRAGRGDPVYYTHYSGPKFVWSGDVRSAASLTVSPHRVQHFADDSVLLSCEGNSTEWQVKRFFEDGYLSYLPYCPFRGTMTGFTCYIDPNHLLGRTAVYWCESGSGEFSNAVNITANYDVILVSPVHPVTEGDSVTFGCKLRTEELLSNVAFYKNDELIQNNDRVDLNISAVSKSDEGFYSCKYSGKVSRQSWMSVKCEYD
ncbi:basement membrane-specific heparan sulfate proteoglycan core protein-like [Epinephelus moara]|uniref:basement membrane-specific heparan sulfate proteoglycan core protein-like n=1 Tax=Epinephelus moara TaxID=300413 RepID=UPI00214E59B3|nr:basement membrane-specific heparan sulfate proteoglycan core protein-like [Epinephelus moara]